LKALVLKDYNLFSYEDAPMPEVGVEEVLVKIMACSICGSDVHGMDGSSGRRKPPIIMGHEAAGIIEKVGKDVEDYEVGDRVTFDSTVYCGKCFYCKQGKVNLCDHRIVLGVSCEEYRKNGAMAQYLSVPERILYKLPEKVQFEQAALIEPLAIALHAVNQTPITINDQAVVFGVGTIGSLIVQILRLAGCGKIIAVDLDQSKLDLACKNGADIGLNPGEINIIEKIKELTNGRGADIAFEAIGISKTVNYAISTLRKGGALTLVGNVSTSIDFPLQSVVTREILINSSCASAGEYRASIDMVAREDVNVEAILSAVVPLKEGASWFERLSAGEAGLMKVVLKPNE
jgi:L-iditol 2-dehydrogenase